MTAINSATRLERADRKASTTVNGQRDSWPMRVVGAVSDIGDQPQMRLLCAATIALAVFRRDSRLAATGVRMLAAHTVATWGKSGVKAVVDRTRPESGDDPKVRAGGSDAHAENSFPSGHSAGVVAVAQAVARGYPEHALAARTAALAVSGVQVPRGTHYVGDVVAGALIGLAAERASDAAARAVSLDALIDAAETRLGGSSHSHVETGGHTEALQGARKDDRSADTYKNGLEVNRRTSVLTPFCPTRQLAVSWTSERNRT